MVLLAGAALFVRGLHEANTRRYGWESDHLVTGQPAPARRHLPGRQGDHGLPAPGPGASRSAARRRVRQPLLLDALLRPGRAAQVPRRGSRDSRSPATSRSPSSTASAPTTSRPSAPACSSGRVVQREPTPSPRPKVFVINQAMARGLFGGESPLGRRLAQAGGKTVEWGEIVGVVADVQSVYADRVAVPYQLYQPMAQEPRPGNELAVRATGDRARPPSSTASAPRWRPSTPTCPCASSSPPTIDDRPRQLPGRRPRQRAVLPGRARARPGLAGHLRRHRPHGGPAHGRVRHPHRARSPGPRTSPVSCSLPERSSLSWASAIGLLGAFGISRLIATASSPACTRTAWPS